MDRYNHFVYSEWIARHLKSIGHSERSCHFLRSDKVEEISDLEERISQIVGYVAIAIDGYNSDFAWSNDDNLINIPQYFFAIVRQTESGDIDSVHESKRLCHEELKEVIGRMMMDYEEGNEGLDFLDIENMTVRGIGPLAERFYGVMLGFSMKNPTAFGIDESKWM